MIHGVRKPHLEKLNGVWFCTVYRRVPLSGKMFKFIQCGCTMLQCWENFLVWPGL